MSIIDQIREGDLVEAVRGEEKVVARVYSDGTGILRLRPAGWKALGVYESDGYTLTVVEKAAPPLPTEPGWYSNYYGDAMYLGKDGTWMSSTTHAVTEDEVRRLLPLTRLEPVPETVKRVADYLRGYGRRLAADDVEEHFGVTS